jgi:hypothetical protein
VACSRTKFYSYLPLGLPSVFFTYVYPTKTLLTPLLSLTRATCPAHHILIDLVTLIWCEIQIVKLLFTKSSPFSCYLVPLGQNISLSAIFSNTFSLCSFLDARGKISLQFKISGKITVVHVKIFIFLDSKRTQRFFCISYLRLCTCDWL